jgi:hypothetical protein
MPADEAQVQVAPERPPVHMPPSGEVHCARVHALPVVVFTASSSHSPALQISAGEHPADVQSAVVLQVASFIPVLPQFPPVVVPPQKPSIAPRPLASQTFPSDVQQASLFGQLPVEGHVIVQMFTSMKQVAPGPPQSALVVHDMP